jgi:hypothetical protein
LRSLIKHIQVILNLLLVARRPVHPAALVVANAIESMLAQDTLGISGSDTGAAVHYNVALIVRLVKSEAMLEFHVRQLQCGVQVLHVEVDCK